MCIATRDIMDSMFEAYLEATIEPDDIPNSSKEPVYILGKKYHAVKDISDIRLDIRSRLWITYRKNFVAICDVEEGGHTSDKGWGCMLRCGQMMLAQALLWRHMGRDWVWERGTKDATYLRIVNKFEDRRQAPFSIHQIALMGVSEGKRVGQWFGPNTIAQVLKKLVKYDTSSSLHIHVAMDNAVIISEIKEECIKCGASSAPFVTPEDTWKPLLLVIPLRLGLHGMNPIYMAGLQRCFQFRQSLGVIGGKPNLALYFIGCVGNEVIYLDPHTTQKAGKVGSNETHEQIDMDATYHCKYASRMPLLSMDPSIAVCFFCNTEFEFNDLCQRIKDELITPEHQPLFEIAYERPRTWCPPLDVAIEATAASVAMNDLDCDYRTFDEDHDFEII